MFLLQRRAAALMQSKGMSSVRSMPVPYRDEADVLTYLKLVDSSGPLEFIEPVREAGSMTEAVTNEQAS